MNPACPVTASQLLPKGYRRENRQIVTDSESRLSPFCAPPFVIPSAARSVILSGAKNLSLAKANDWKSQLPHLSSETEWRA